ncbi:MAG: class I SAM-dependent methyltransferase [Campylobacterota bacterium]|nr:class I SAM-dependent methyltransferase [Campylobacterota bacterium]
MIPFNHLGWFFKTFGTVIYPKSVRQSLCNFLKPILPKARVLDVGSGTGVMSDFAHKCRDDLHFIAVDPAEGMLKFSKQYIQTHQGTAESLPFNDNDFDVVVMGESLHHFSDVDQAIQETVRVLKKEGRLFIYDFDSSTFMGKSICLGEKLLGEPGNFFIPVELKKILESYGFKVHITEHSWRYTISAQLQ